MADVRTRGSINAQEINQEASQLRKKLPTASSAKLAIPEAIMDANPDWMAPKTKWL